MKWSKKERIEFKKQVKEIRKKHPGLEKLIGSWCLISDDVHYREYIILIKEIKILRIAVDRRGQYRIKGEPRGPYNFAVHKHLNITYIFEVTGCPSIMCNYFGLHKTTTLVTVPTALSGAKILKTREERLAAIKTFYDKFIHNSFFL